MAAAAVHGTFQCFVVERSATVYPPSAEASSGVRSFDGVAPVNRSSRKTDMPQSAPLAAVSVEPDTATSLPDKLARLPQALLLDFGGVIIATSKRPQGRAELAQALQNRLAEVGIDLPVGQLQACLSAGSTALKHWKHASSRRLEPRELTVAEILGDFYFADLPDQARAVLIGDGAELLDTMSTTLTDHLLRPGIRELIQFCQDHHVALGIVSNAHSGRSHRRILKQLGLEAVFGVQIYSDEAGIRKPHPQMLTRAAAALGAAAADCWYVGDTLDRDLVAGRRAGVGAVVLTRSQHTDKPPFSVDNTAEATVEDPAALVEILQVAQLPHATAASLVETSAAPVPSDGPPAASLTFPVRGDDDAAYDTTVRAVLLDHGGVVSDSVAPSVPFTEAAMAVETALSRAGCSVEPGGGQLIVEAAHAEYKNHKDAQDESSRHREITPLRYWAEFTADSVTEQQRQVLAAEAEALQLALYRSKSVKTERAGIRHMLQHCREAKLPVIIVSNTIFGTGVRSIIRGYGLGDQIAAWACSDEFGWKKPHASIFHYALEMAGVAPQHAAMIGDKPFNDAFGAQQAGIATRIITRGGSATDAEIAHGLNAGWITHVVEHPGQAATLLT